MRAFPQSSFARRPPVRPAGLEAFDATGAWRAPRLRRFDAHVANDCDANDGAARLLDAACGLEEAQTLEDAGPRGEAQPACSQKPAAIPRAPVEIAGARLWLVAACAGVMLGLLSLLAALSGTA